MKNFKTAAVIFMLVAAVLVVVLCVVYAQGAERLQQHESLYPGVRILARPVRISIGQLIPPDDIRRHLESIGYAENSQRQPGSFSVNDAGKLTVWARYPELSNVTIAWDGGRISKMTAADGRDLDDALLEPETIRTTLHLAGNEPVPIMRTEIPFSQVNGTPLLDAILSSEDALFLTHHGLDILRLALTPVKHLLYVLTRNRRFAGGASTMTMQVARLCVLQDLHRTIARKVDEIGIAMALERLYSKEELLRAYINNSYLGSAGGLELHGFAAAAQHYYGIRNIGALDAEQAATLVALLNGPARYLGELQRGNDAPLRAQRNRVLRLMNKNFPQKYPSDMIENLRSQPVRLNPSPQPASASDLRKAAAYFMDYAGSSIPNLQSGRIYWTVDANLQRAAQAAVHDALQSRPEGPELQGALVALDARNGELLALVGGTEYTATRFNRAVSSRRSPGSSIKPFVYAAALAWGDHRGQPFTAATLIDPVNDPVDGWRPASHVGGAARVRVQLAQSDNGAAVVAAHDAGLGTVQQFIASVLGRKPVRHGMLAIGGAKDSEVTPLELAAAYSIFPNNGLKVSPRSVWAAYENDFEVKTPAPERVRAIEPGPAFITSQMLRSVIGDSPDGMYGTAREARSLAGLEDTVQFAGKTGTSQLADLWFVGFTPSLIVVVWVGNDQNQPLNMSDGFAGARWALPIWARFMEAVKKYRSDLLEGRFEQPESVRRLSIDPVRGCVTDTSGMTEYFIVGRFPKSCLTQ